MRLAARLLVCVSCLDGPDLDEDVAMRRASMPSCRVLWYLFHLVHNIVPRCLCSCLGGRLMPARSSIRWVCVPP